MLLDRLADDGLQLVGVPGLGDVAEDVSLVDRVDDGPDVGVGGEEQAGGLRPDGLAWRRTSTPVMPGIRWSDMITWIVGGGLEDSTASAPRWQVMTWYSIRSRSWIERSTSGSSSTTRSLGETRCVACHVPRSSTASGRKGSRGSRSGRGLPSRASAPSKFTLLPEERFDPERRREAVNQDSCGKRLISVTSLPGRCNASRRPSPGRSAGRTRRRGARACRGRRGE